MAIQSLETKIDSMVQDDQVNPIGVDSTEGALPETAQAPIPTTDQQTFETYEVAGLGLGMVKQALKTAPGTYNLTASLINYSSKTINNIVLTSGNESTITIELDQNAKKLDEIVIVNKRSSAKATSLESPLSIQRMTTEEIKRNPGGNFDISKVIQSLPGVGGGVGGGGYRNDIVIRGGAPSENVYYLDGIEIPILNHFGTQGSGGGPLGILNANFIEEVKWEVTSM